MKHPESRCRWKLPSTLLHLRCLCLEVQRSRGPLGPSVNHWALFSSPAYSKVPDWSSFIYTKTQERPVHGGQSLGLWPFKIPIIGMAEPGKTTEPGCQMSRSLFTVLNGYQTPRTSPCDGVLHRVDYRKQMQAQIQPTLCALPSPTSPLSHGS